MRALLSLRGPVRAGLFMPLIKLEQLFLQLFLRERCYGHGLLLLRRHVVL